jgi:transglutaminase-like putative cysteine protease
MLAALGTLSLGGGVFTVVAGLATLGCLWPQVAPVPRREDWNPVHAGVLVLAIGVAFATEVVAGLAALAAWLLVQQRWARGPDAGRNVLLLATLVLLVGSLRADHPVLGVLFLSFAGALPLALLALLPWGPDPGPGRPARAALAGGTVLATAVLFATMPRLEGGLFGTEPVTQGRFPTDMEPGSGALTSDDLAQVMRVRVTTPDGVPIPGPVYVRARVLEQFDGRRWTAGTPPEPIPPLRPNVRAEVELDAEPGMQLYGVGEILRIDGAPGVHRVAEGVFQHRAPGQPLAYVAWGHRAEDGTPLSTPEERWVALPRDLDPRIGALAWSVARDAAPASVVEALHALLMRDYRYGREPEPSTPDPSAAFLFARRTGNCEHFASALALLLRARGIPARVATGFYSEETDAEGRAVIRRGHAHAWTEVRTLDGWRTLDATPPGGLPTPESAGLRARVATLVGAWYRVIVGYDMEAQFAAYGLLGRPLVGGGAGGAAPFRAGIVGMLATIAALTVGLGALRLGVAAWSGAGRVPDDPMRAAARTAREVVARAGHPLPEHLPLREAAAWLAARAGTPAGAAFAAFADAWYAARYGGDTAADAGLADRLDALRRTMRAKTKTPTRQGRRRWWAILDLNQ